MLLTSQTALSFGSPFQSHWIQVGARQKSGGDTLHFFDRETLNPFLARPFIAAFRGENGGPFGAIDHVGGLNQGTGGALGIVSEIIQIALEEINQGISWRVMKASNQG